MVDGVAGGEGNLVLIFWMRLDLIVPRVGIHEVEEFVARSCIDYLVYAGQREAILRTGVIQVSEVDAYSSFRVLFH